MSSTQLRPGVLLQAASESFPESHRPEHRRPSMFVPASQPIHRLTLLDQSLDAEEPRKGH